MLRISNLKCEENIRQRLKFNFVQETVHEATSRGFMPPPSKNVSKPRLGQFLRSMTLRARCMTLRARGLVSS